MFIYIYIHHSAVLCQTDLLMRTKANTSNSAESKCCSQVTFIYNNTNCNKALHSIKVTESNTATNCSDAII